MSQFHSFDSNFIPNVLACLNTDTVQGANMVQVQIDPITGGILTDPSSTISFTMNSVYPGDERYIGVWLFQGTDGKTYPAAATSAGALLIDTS
jgi:hypothetical protein